MNWSCQGNNGAADARFLEFTNCVKYVPSITIGNTWEDDQDLFIRIRGHDSEIVVCKLYIPYIRGSYFKGILKGGIPFAVNKVIQFINLEG